MPPSRARASMSSMQIGSPDRLPLVATTGSPSASHSRVCSGLDGSISPSAGTSGATAGAIRTAVSLRRASSRMGAAGLPSSRASAASIAQSPAACARVPTIRAKGLCGRRLRARSRDTAASSAARTHSWKPPVALTATMRPARSAWTAAARASSSWASGVPAASLSASRGPQAAQQIPCAWKRRSAGSRYSAAQAAHGVKSRSVVRSRS